MSAKQNMKIIGYVDLSVGSGAYGYRKSCLSPYVFVYDFKRARLSWAFHRAADKEGEKKTIKMGDINILLKVAEDGRGSWKPRENSTILKIVVKLILTMDSGLTASRS